MGYTCPPILYTAREGIPRYTKIIRSTCASQRAESRSLAIRMLRRRCCPIRRSISKQRRVTAHDRKTTQIPGLCRCLASGFCQREYFFSSCKVVGSTRTLDVGSDDRGKARIALEIEGGMDLPFIKPTLK